MKENGIHELSEKITQRLLWEIREGRYADCEKLPPEVTVAKEMGVSRTLIRDCLATLEREGFISRKHGVGTIINQHVLSVTTRMDLEKEFLEMVSDAGYRSEMIPLEIGKCEADADIAGKLHLSEGDGIFRVARLVTADGVPAIYCIDYISQSSVVADEYDMTLLGKPVFQFIEKYCQKKIFMDLTEVRPLIAGEQLAEILKVDAKDPILYMDEVGYTFTGEPLLYSKEYYVDGILHHKVLRKKI
ncbi:MAG: GntR family transcriptional regulator [Coprococcus sp.]